MEQAETEAKLKAGEAKLETNLFDEEIKDLIDFTDEEYDTKESYRQIYGNTTCEKYYNQQNESSSVVSNKCTPDNLKLPKLRLKEYDLMPRSWVAFGDNFVIQQRSKRGFYSHEGEGSRKSMSFLRHEVEGEEHRVLAETAFGNGMKRKETHKPVYKDEPTTATVIANSCAGKNNSVSCDRSHPSQECQKISNMHYDDRKEQVMRKRCCLVCLKPGHMTKKCHSNVRCLICERRHYVLLCPDLRKEVLSQGLFGGGIYPAAEHGTFSVTVESLDRKYSTSLSKSS
ncbi:transposable element Tc1 transposase [Caerostris extrusa]|uniref:Transposable element Tc1 transposase n=1 Tax=Caerostris extrusa TaxID=172846 RepID=A0AAV4T8R8_CAEEX|nr:transposable element Tc1 transposase [Caerostris extrusa]